QQIVGRIPQDWTFTPRLTVLKSELLMMQALMAPRYIFIVLAVLVCAAALLFIVDQKSLIPGGPHSTILFQAREPRWYILTSMTLSLFLYRLAIAVVPTFGTRTTTV